MLVADIPAYPKFLPWCGGARVVSEQADIVTAEIEIAYGGVRKSFTTRNRVVKDALMEMRLIEGPFRHLEGHWRFTPLEERASKVELDLDFDFANALLALAVGPVFSSIANGLVDSFRRRAVDLYGKR